MSGRLLAFSNDTQLIVLTGYVLNASSWRSKGRENPSQYNNNILSNLDDVLIWLRHTGITPMFPGIHTRFKSASVLLRQRRGTTLLLLAKPATIQIETPKRHCTFTKSMDQDPLLRYNRQP